jgi:hypothetical protein
MSKDNPTLIESATFPRHVIAEIQRAAKTGIYDIRGFGAKRDILPLMTWFFLGHQLLATLWRGIEKNVPLKWFWEIDLQKILSI